MMIVHRITRIWLAVAAVLIAAVAGAPATSQTFPALSGRVVDAANIIPADQEAQLTADLAALERDRQIQFVIATVPSLQGRTIEDYGYRLGRAWAIGRKDVNDGVILLVAPNDRKVRIEVGYGMTPVLTAALSGFIVSEKILPRFRDGDMPAGIRAGADEIIAQLRLPAPQAEARAKRIMAEQAKQKDDGSDWIILIFWGAVVLFIIVPMLFRGKGGRRYNRHGAPVVIWGPGTGSGWGSGSSGGGWSSGGGGGGFSGGGGSFGGGGASGSW